MKDFYNETIETLEETLIQNGFKAFNARQLFEWVYRHKTIDIDSMTNLSKKLKQFFQTYFYFSSIAKITKQVSHDQTTKYLFKLSDNQAVETVLMHHEYGKSLCVTTQLGCNIGCSFCASGLQKKIRNLTIAEMMHQVLMVEALENIRISNVVLMGTGEPFDNFEATMGFIDNINSPYGLAIGARHITVSTSGIAPKIKAFADFNKQVNLAISLHAPNDVLRTQLMKINARYSLDELLESVRYYIEKTNRRVTFEYLLLEGINDEMSHANALSDLIRGVNCYVNLIRYNTVRELPYKGSSESRAMAFYMQLLKRGIQATLRKEKGSDIDAACGQLRAKNN